MGLPPVSFSLEKKFRNETSFLWKEGDREAVEVGSQALFLEEGARRAGDAPQ